jgi:hypothetical protein
MKKFFIPLLGVFFTWNVAAQVKVGDNPTTINANSVLELESTDKGLLLPRIELTSTAAAAPLAAHVAGMTVYNTATAGAADLAVTPGKYYNDGTKWVRVQEAFTPKEFTFLVYTDGADPNSSTIFGDVNPPVADDPLLKENTDYLYIASDETNWVWNGSAYVTYTVPAATEWYKAKTTIDAGSDKTGGIERKGQIAVGKYLDDNYGIISNLSTDNPSFGDRNILSAVRGNISNQATDVNNQTMWAGYFGATNNKDASFATIEALRTNSTHNGTGRIANLIGQRHTHTASATSGGVNSSTVFSFNSTNNSTNTDPGTSMYGIDGLVAQNSSQRIGTVVGQRITAQTGNSATIGGITTMRGLDVTTNYRTTNPATGNNTNLQGINNSVLKSSSDITANMWGYAGSVNLSGEGNVSGGMRGISVNLSNSSTNTTGGQEMIGILSSLSHTSTTHTVNNVYGLQNSLTANGRIGQGLFGQRNTINFTNTTGNNIPNAYLTENVFTNLSNTTTTIGNLFGHNTTLNNNSNFALVSNLIGSRTTISSGSQATGTVASMMGNDINVTDNSAHDVTNMYGAYLKTNTGGTFTKTVNNIYGLRIGGNVLNNNATKNNYYGIYIDNATASNTAINRWSIYSDGGNSYFKDNVGIGTTTPTSKLQVVGLPVHADNAAAITAGLTAGAFYHAGDGIVRVVF